MNIKTPGNWLRVNTEADPEFCKFSVKFIMINDKKTAPVSALLLIQVDWDAGSWPSAAVAGEDASAGWWRFPHSG